jgi:hypothetical protein
VRNSEYFRAQARLYRDISHLLSDRQASEHALLKAMEYLARAQRQEEEEQVSEHLSNGRA